MRFSTILAFTAAAGMAAAAPHLREMKMDPVVKRAPEGDVQVLGKGICLLEKALGITALSDFLDTTLGGAITDLEDQLGVTDLEKALGLLDCEEATAEEEPEKLSDLQVIGKGVCLLEKGLGVTATSDALDKLLGGAVSTLEEQLGVTYAEEVLKLTPC